MLGMVMPLTDMGWGDHMGDWGAGWWIVMAFGMVVFWGLVIVGIAWLMRSIGTTPHHDRGPSGSGLSAVELLDLRLAEGGISPEEYRERRSVLREETGTEGS